MVLYSYWRSYWWDILRIARRSHWPNIDCCSRKSEWFIEDRFIFQQNDDPPHYWLSIRLCFPQVFKDDGFEEEVLNDLQIYRLWIFLKFNIYATQQDSLEGWWQRIVHEGNSNTSQIFQTFRSCIQSKNRMSIENPLVLIPFITVHSEFGIAKILKSGWKCSLKFPELQNILLSLSFYFHCWWKYDLPELCINKNRHFCWFNALWPSQY